MTSRDDTSEYSVCPNCGEDLPDKATFCRECGASDDSGWNDAESWDDREADDLDDPDFDYDDFIAREFPDQAEPLAGASAAKWFLMGLVIIVLVATLILGTLL